MSFQLAGRWIVIVFALLCAAFFAGPLEGADSYGNFARPGHGSFRRRNRKCNCPGDHA